MNWLARIPLWLRPLLLFAGLLLLLAAIASFAPPRKTTFTIQAKTDALTVEPNCGQSLIWDLPPGELRALGVGGQPDAFRKVGPVSLVIRAGTRAVIERREQGEWRVVVKPLEGEDRCAAAARAGPADASRSAEPLPAAARITAVRLKYQDADGRDIENESVEPSADGYAYRSVGGEAQPAPLRLTGRVLLGNPVLEGGGWAGSRAGMLRGASVEGRVRHSVGEQVSVLLHEDVDLGSMIDTHACLDSLLTEQGRFACEDPGVDAAVGFAAPASEVDGKTIDVVVHREAYRIGVLPYAGEQRRLSVTWWTALLYDPLAQQVALALFVITQLLGHYDVLRRPLNRLCGNGEAESETSSGKEE